MDWTQYIDRDPQVMLGKPVFRGTRITVEFVLDRLSQGATADDLLSNYEGLRPEHIPAALAYAAATIRNDELVAAR
ncbi:MAG TPA: DUF433 domain-containing protein [Tepidisphaeraceae bacterium]|jgi:uncharacterized protein (DUF433 family)|nr:DUF433 domain-containing protein [Tepidisphaeraceae bacterium]